ncbi:MAG: hypothetical protein Q7J07_02455 [Pelolinea sp.]|nr:hypothetical protein [Pelolinea sp.]
MNNNNKPRIIFLTLFVVGLLLISACSGNTEEMMNEDNDVPNPESANQVTLESQDTTKSIEASNAGLPADPQAMSFSTVDGIDLSGVFYPAKEKSQPLLILMHWAPGDQNDWVEIAQWLQNRGIVETGTDSDKSPWLDTSWFPDMDE